MKNWFKVVRAITLVGQLGFTLLTPPVALLLLAWWLQDRFGLGSWVMVVGLLFGLVTSGASAWRFWKRLSGSLNRQQEKQETPVVFYHHE